MYEEYFTEEHQIFRASVRKFVEREISPHIDRWEDEELFPVELYRRCAAEGFLGIGYPEAYGGYGCAREYLVERLYRDSRILSIGVGTTEIMKEIIGKVTQL